ncbi:MAG: rod shape-determining protein [Planctomycetaceae bacterium]|nr:rod shape-determining protein [Planctomycetaceae bacterium]
MSDATNNAAAQNAQAQPQVKIKKKPDSGVLYVGIDLGTSRSAIAASNGQRVNIPSFVAYPKDVISMKALKKEKLFGEEALKHRLSCDFFRPMEKGEIKYSDRDQTTNKGGADKVKQAAIDLLHHVVSLANPRSDELVYGVIGAPAQASIHNKKLLLEAARGVFDSVIVCSEPFAVAYGLDYFQDTLVIDIGAGTTDLCRMHGTLPEETDQITISHAGDSIDQYLFDQMKQKCAGASFNLNMVKQIKEKWGFVGRISEPVVVTLPVNGRPTQFDISTEIRNACRTIIKPSVDAIGNLIGSFDPEFQEHLRNNVLLGGGGSQIIGLAEEIEVALQELGGGKVRRVDEPVFAGANGALKLAHDMPAEYWQELATASA